MDDLVVSSVNVRSDHRKNATQGDVLSMVTHVDQTWNSLLKGLEQIDAVFDIILFQEEL